MTFIEATIVLLIAIITGILLSVILVTVMGEIKNPTPRTDNDAPRFFDVPNLLIQNIFEYKTN